MSKYSNTLILKHPDTETQTLTQPYTHTAIHSNNQTKEHSNTRNTQTLNIQNTEVLKHIPTMLKTIRK